MDASPNRRNKVAFSNSSCVVWTEPKSDLVTFFFFQLDLTTDLMKSVRVDRKLFKFWTRNLLNKDYRL